MDFVNPGGNAAKAGIKNGDTILYTSSWFGDELWPAGVLGMDRTKRALPLLLPGPFFPFALLTSVCSLRALQC